MVWWIASWADDDEQYKEEQPREGLFLAGGMNCWEEFSHASLSLIVFPRFNLLRRGVLELSELVWLRMIWIISPSYGGG